MNEVEVGIPYYNVSSNLLRIDPTVGHHSLQFCDMVLWY
jgi:hypothetical protein